MCENCETWFHINCENINEFYDNLGRSLVVWVCLTCDSPNYCDVLFDLHLHSIETNNLFKILNDTSFLSNGSIQKISFLPIKPKPESCIGPSPLRIINYQSLVNWKAPLFSVIDSTRPDDIIAAETWFNSSIHDSEYFSSHYNIFRRDQSSGVWGQQLAHQAAGL